MRISAGTGILGVWSKQKGLGGGGGARVGMTELSSNRPHFSVCVIPLTKYSHMRQNLS